MTGLPSRSVGLSWSTTSMPFTTQAVVKGSSQQPYVSEIMFDPSFGTHVVVVAAPIFDDLQKSVIGAVTVLLRRDTLFHSIADVTIGSTGHAMLFTTDGTPVICPILAPEEHSVKPELINVLATLKSGWTVAADDSHGSKDSLLGFAPVRDMTMARDDFVALARRLMERLDTLPR